MGGGKGKIWMYLLGALPAVWLGLLIAPYLSGDCRSWSEALEG